MKRHPAGSSSKTAGPVKSRISVGVTGHRHIQSSEALRRGILGVLDAIASRHTGSGRKKNGFCILTPLAEGADRIVPMTALNSARFPGTTVWAILPLVLSDYLADFRTPASKREFLGLLKRAGRMESLRKTALSEDFPGAQEGDPALNEARIRAYEDAGRFVVDHCEALIALWDGKSAMGRGGTAEIVEYARRIGRPVYVIDPGSA